jgi:carbonic anhydrase
MKLHAGCSACLIFGLVLSLSVSADEQKAPAKPAPAVKPAEGATGPQAWARLAPEYAKCGNGERQSPFDIRDGMKLDLEPITFEYRPSGFKVVDNGHTIQANVGGWNSMRVMGRRFKLVQFHFHSPSEESIDGRQYEMVVHLVQTNPAFGLSLLKLLGQRLQAATVHSTK